MNTYRVEDALADWMPHIRDVQHTARWKPNPRRKNSGVSKGYDWYLVLAKIESEKK